MLFLVFTGASQLQCFPHTIHILFCVFNSYCVPYRWFNKYLLNECGI